MELSIADLRMTSVPIYRQTATGRKFRASNGKMKDETVGVEYATITTGEDMTIAEWYRLMDEAVEREGKTALLMAITEYCREHCAWLRTDREVHEYALSILSSGSYQKWQDFKVEGMA